MPTAPRQKIDVQDIPLLSLPFVPFAERKHLPRLAAIYFVLNAQGTVLYVGQSINLAVRWSAHHRAAKLIEHQATRIAWLIMDDATLLNAVEAACIAYFEPLCNAFHDGRRAGRPATEAAAYTTLTVRLPPALLAVLRDHGSRYHMSLNAEILSAVEERVAAIEKAQRARETGKARRTVLSTV